LKVYDMHGRIHKFFEEESDLSKGVLLFFSYIFNFYKGYQKNSHSNFNLDDGSEPLWTSPWLHLRTTPKCTTPNNCILRSSLKLLKISWQNKFYFIQFDLKLYSMLKFPLVFPTSFWHISSELLTHLNESHFKANLSILCYVTEKNKHQHSVRMS